MTKLWSSSTNKNWKGCTVKETVDLTFSMIFEIYKIDNNNNNNQNIKIKILIKEYLLSIDFIDFYFLFKNM